MTKIYKIYFKSDPNTIYIGKTGRTLKRRFYEHLNRMKRGKKSKLYNWLRKYISQGEKPIIELITKTKTGCKTEKLLIKEYKLNGYRLKNTAKGGEGKPVGLLQPEEFKKWISEYNKKIGRYVGKNNPWYGKSGSKNHLSKKIYQYNLDGTYIQSYESITLAAKAINNEDGRKFLARACKTKEIAYGYLWRTTYQPRIKAKKRKKKKMTKEEIKKAKDLFNQGMSLTKIAKQLGYSRGQITRKIKNS